MSTAEIYGALIGSAIGIAVLWLQQKAYRVVLRDYFAAQWLTTFAIQAGANVTAGQIAHSCYQVADAMLEARAND